MSKTCEKCIHHDVCRYPVEGRAYPETCWKYKEERPRGEWLKELKRVREQTRWIPCSERLPSHSERIVLATVVRRDKTWNNEPYHRLVTYINGKWYPMPQSINLVPCHMATIEQSDGGQAEVIAWMPLLKPYKEEGEAE